MKISLYIHIPFCVRKCLYCDFLSFSANENLKKSYIEALTKEIAIKSGNFKDFEVTSIFIGGGTPSTVSAKDINTILLTVYDNFSIEKDCEITIEVNPGTEVDVEAYMDSGINRISIGLQSALDDELKLLGRIHKRNDFEELYNRLLFYNFPNINVDLMSGLPNQSIEKYKASLDYLLSLKRRPDHISAYSLIVEEDTPFATMELNLPAEDDERKMYEITDDMLKKAGYNRYEISNYSMPGKECRHNTVYWKRGQYLGLGLGASSFTEKTRYKNTSDINGYFTADYSRYEEIKLSDNDEMEEFMFLGLRMCEGISINEFEKEFKRPLPEQFAAAILKYEKMGYINKINDKVMLTKEGINISNVILSEFLF